MKSLSPRRMALLCTALVGAASGIGLLLRVLYPEDMEYKEDEAYYYVQSQIIGTHGYWPWVGIPSGAYLRNPAGSIWIFAWLARAVGAIDPVHLSQALRVFQWVSLFLIFPVFGRLLRQNPRLVKTLESSKNTAMLWVVSIFCWTMVNPFLIYYARKLWTQAFLPAFTLGSLYFFLGRKESRWNAALWGVLGAVMGQIHMGGFFFALGVFLSALLPRESRKSTHWGAWILGSLAGAWPLIPWLWDAWNHPPVQAMTRGWEEMIQFKFWVFALTQPFGLHLGTVMGAYLGPTQLQQLSDFIRYPLVGNFPTYGVALAHIGLAGLLCVHLWKVISGIVTAVKKRRLLQSATPEEGWTQLLVYTLGLGGLALTLTGVQIRRYYLAAFFPLDQAWALRNLTPRLIWWGFWAQFLIASSFVQSTHRNQGAPAGDYGHAYHTMVATNPDYESKPTAD